MKCLVPVKRVIDPYVTIRVKSDNSDVETDNVKMSMNPFDEIAMEEAMRLKEKGIVSEIIAVSIGNSSVTETLRQALARGADKAILVATEDHYESLIIAKILKTIVEKNSIDLVIMGKQAIDADSNQTGQMLSALLEWSQATFASKIDIDKDNKSATCVREIDGGLETIKLKLPAVITTDLRLNEPRYISLPNVMQAKRKPLETIEVNSLNVECNNKITTLKVESPQKRTAGIKVNNVAELVEKLKTEAKVL